MEFKFKVWLAGSVALFYFCSCRWLRNKRKRKLVQWMKLGKAEALSSNKGLKENINDDTQYLKIARKVNNELGELEFPTMTRLSLEFGLFRTYAIPSISSLLEKTGEFRKRPDVRYDDTDLILREILENEKETERSQLALTRLNEIHGYYGDKITNEDMLYTLSIFILEPIRWISKYEFRALEKEEEEAIYLTWRDIGKGMNIQNIPSSLAALEVFNVQYEKDHMVFNKANPVVGNYTIDLFLSLLPRWCHSFTFRAMLTLMDERLLKSFGWSEKRTQVSFMLVTFVEAVFQSRKFFLKWVTLPRPVWLTRRRTPYEQSSGCPRSNDHSSSAEVANLVFCPRYNIYKAPYKNGYQISKLGPHTRQKN